MTKKDIIAIVAKDTGYQKQIVTEITNSVLDNIIAAMVEGNRVTFAGFGSFERKYRAPRAAKNLLTGEPISVPSKFVPRFSPGKRMKRAVTIEINSVS